MIRVDVPIVSISENVNFCTCANSACLTSAANPVAAFAAKYCAVIEQVSPMIPSAIRSRHIRTMKSENSRLVSPMFLERYRRFLKPGGVVHLKTDSTFLFEYTKAVCSANGLKVLACTSDLYSGDREAMRESALASVCGADAVDALFEVQTFYEKNFLKQGFKINYISFTIDREGDFVYPDFDAAYWRAAEAPRPTNREK